MFSLISAQLTTIDESINDLVGSFHFPASSHAELNSRLSHIKLLIDSIKKAMNGNYLIHPTIPEKIAGFSAVVLVLENELAKKIACVGASSIGRSIGEASSLVPPDQQRSSSSSRGASTLLDEHPLSSLNLRQMIPDEIVFVKNNIYQIKCFDQNTLPFGGSRCGVHALLHALYVLAIVNGYDTGPAIGLFQNVESYQYFEKLVLQTRSCKDHDDVNEPELREVWRAIVAKKINPFPGTDPSDWIEDDISIFHVGDDSIEGGLSVPSLKVTSGPSLESLINLKEVARRRGSFHHAFIVGAKGHWTTLIYERHIDQIFWYGIDSRRNIQEAFCSNIPILEEAISTIEEKAYPSYFSSLGEDLQKRCNLLIPSDTGYELASPDDQKIFFGPLKIRAKYLPDLRLAALFMLRMGWLDKSSPQYVAYEEDIRYLKVILDFYRQTHFEDPLLREIDQLLAT